MTSRDSVTHSLTFGLRMEPNQLFNRLQASLLNLLPAVGSRGWTDGTLPNRIRFIHIAYFAHFFVEWCQHLIRHEARARLWQRLFVLDQGVGKQDVGTIVCSRSHGHGRDGLRERKSIIFRLYAGLLVIGTFNLFCKFFSLFLRLFLNPSKVFQWLAIELRDLQVRVKYELQYVLECPNVFNVQSEDELIVEDCAHLADPKLLILILLFFILCLGRL